MKKEITFLLNNEKVTAEVNPTESLLDYLRNEKHLTGVKSVCREGDCGACSVLIGELKGNELKYKNVTSCIYPLGKVAGKHVVTIEGLNKSQLNFVQYHFAEENAAQCGFCTPGYIISLTAYLLNNSGYSFAEAEKAIAGNVCRCTGYGSIKRAVQNMTSEFTASSGNASERLKVLIEKNVIPEYFIEVPELLKNIESSQSQFGNGIIIGGGTDLYVQKPDEIAKLAPLFVDDKNYNFILDNENEVVVGGGVTFEEFSESEIIRNVIPSIEKDSELIASLLIRNMATIAGNLVNASPIGDLSIILLAVDAKLKLLLNESSKIIPLREFFIDYKKTAKQPLEIISEIIIPKRKGDFKFNFEKVSKRTHLDIASVNSAIELVVSGDEISHASVSCGGVAPVPKFLSSTSEYLCGKPISVNSVIEASKIAMNEVSPIDDIRGSAKYKKLLLSRLIKAHFVELFPEKIKAGEIL